MVQEMGDGMEWFCIVLLNGITEHGFSSEIQNTTIKSFRTRFPGSSVEVFDFLPESLRHCAPTNLLQVRAKEVLQQLTQNKVLTKDESENGDTGTRRAMFLCHNIGGSLLKQILLLAKDRKAYRWLIYRTTTIYFFGTPHRTNCTDGWDSIILRLISFTELDCAQALNSLQETLRDASDNFIFHYPGYEIVNFYETRSIRNDGSLIVDKHSATFDLPNEERVPLPTDHMGLWNFTEPSEAAEAIWTRIEKWVQKGGSTDHDLTCKRLLHTLSKPDPIDHQLQYTRTSQGTMDWIVCNKVYSKWKSDKTSSVLHVYGPSGSGCTVACSYILNDARRSTADTSTAIISFSLDGFDHRRNSYSSILRSLSRQIMISKPHLLGKIQHVKSLMSEKSTPTVAELWILLRSILSYPAEFPVLCIINRVDQLTSSWEAVVEDFVDLASLSQSRLSPLKFVLTSTRPSTTLHSDVFNSISLLDEMKMTNVVQDFCRDKISNLAERWPIWKGFEHEVLAKLAATAHYSDIALKMCLLEKLKKHQTKKSVQSQIKLAQLSREKIFETILLDHVPHDAHSTLNWIFHSRRPLTLYEISVTHALEKVSSSGIMLENTGTDEGNSLFGILDQTISWTPAEDLRPLDGLIIKIINEEVHFIHGSIRTVFEESCLFEKNFHAKVASKCIDYLEEVALRHTDNSKGLNNLTDRDIVFSFLDYAKEFWPDHYSLVGLDDILTTRVATFLSNDKNSQFLIKWSMGLVEMLPDKEEDGGLPFLVASRLGFAEVLDKLPLGEGGCRRVGLLKSALDLAAEEGHRSVVKKLLDLGAVSDDALCLASRNGHIGVLECLLGCKGNGSESNNTGLLEKCLMLASKRGHLDIVTRLLSCGILATVVDDTGSTPVHYAARLGVRKIVEKLIEYGGKFASYNKDCYNPLQLAAEGGFSDVVTLLVDHIDPNISHANIPPPLHLASQYGHVQTAKALVKAGVDFRSNFEGIRPLHRASKEGCLALFQWFLSPDAQGSDNDVIEVGKINQLEFLQDRDNDGKTALHLAAEYGHLKIVRTAVLIQPDTKLINAVTYDNWTPLHFSTSKGYLSITKRLIISGGRIDSQTNSGFNPFHLAALGGHHLIIRELFQSAKQSATQMADQENYDGQTPLYLAVQNGNLSVINEFLMQDKNSFTKTEDTSTTKDIRPLLLAIENGQTAVIELLIKNGWDVNCQDDCSKAPLHLASSTGDSRTVNLLIKRNALLNVVDEAGNTALHLAVQKRHLEIVDILARVGADCNVKNGYHETALYYAAANAYTDAVKVILSGSPSVQANTKCRLGWTALHAATESLETMKSLVENKGDLKIKNDYGSTPIILAAESGSVEVIRYLLGKNADPNDRNKTRSSALHRAAQNGHLEVVKELVKAGAEVNARKEDGSTPLYWSVASQDFEVVEALLEEQADPNQYGGPFHSPIQLAAWYHLEGIINLLVKHKADVNAAGGRYGNALQAAIDDGHRDTIQLLLNSGADPNLRSEGGLTVFHRAILTSYISMDIDDLLKMLLSSAEVGIDTKDDAGRTPLILAIQARFNGEKVKKLLENGANPNVKDKRGRTALLYAVLGKEMEILQDLLDNNGDLSTKDGCDRGILFWAVNRNFVDIFDLIMDKIAVSPDRTSLCENAMHAAVLYGRIELLKKLLGEDINVDSPDRNGWTPLCTATENGFDEAVQILKSKGATHNKIAAEKPMKWHEHEKFHPLNIAAEGRGIVVGELGFQLENDEGPHGIARADYCMPTDSDVFYFEVTLVQGAPNQSVGIGFCREDIQLNQMLGWREGSWGYHGDDGMVFNQTLNDDYGPTYDTNDVVGCGVNFKAHTAFYTKNGRMIGRAFQGADIRGQLYPAVCFDGSMKDTQVLVNFGTEPFKFTGSLTDPITLESPNSEEILLDISDSDYNY